MPLLALSPPQGWRLSRCILMVCTSHPCTHIPISDVDGSAKDVHVIDFCPLRFLFTGVPMHTNSWRLILWFAFDTCYDHWYLSMPIVVLAVRNFFLPSPSEQCQMEAVSLPEFAIQLMLIFFSAVARSFLRDVLSHINCESNGSLSVCWQYSHDFHSLLPIFLPGAGLIQSICAFAQKLWKENSEHLMRRFMRAIDTPPNLHTKAVFCDGSDFRLAVEYVGRT